MAKSTQQRPAPQILPANWAEIAESIRGRLEREGIRSPEQWRALGRKRHQLFGITRHVVEQLDMLARAKS